MVDSVKMTCDMHTVVIAEGPLGIGKAFSHKQLASGARVFLLERKNSRAEIPSGNGELHRLDCDSANPDSIAKAVETIRRVSDRVDLLVNAAATQLSEFRLNPKGVEMHMAINVLAPYFFTELLRPQLESAVHPRVLNIGTRNERFARFNTEDLSGKNSTHPLEAFNRSKLALAALTYEMADRYRNSRLRINAFHPGFMRFNNEEINLPYFLRMFRALSDRMVSSPQQVAEQMNSLLNAPEFAGAQGRFWHGLRSIRTSVDSRNPQIRRKVWEFCQRQLEESLPHDFRKSTA